MPRYCCLFACCAFMASTASAQRYLGELDWDKKGRVLNLSFSRDGLLVAAAGYPELVKDPAVLRVFDVETRKEVWSRQFKGAPWLTAFRPDGTLVTWDDERTGPLIQIWGGKKWGELRSSRLPEFSPRYQNLMCCSPKADVIACWKAGRWLFFDVDGGKELFSVAHTDPAGQRAFSPDGKRFACIGKDERLRVIDLAQRKTVAVHGRRHWGGSGASNLDFTPDGKRVGLFGIRGSGVVLVEPLTGKVAARYDWQSKLAGWGGVRFMPDGKSVLWRSSWTGFALHDVETGRLTEPGEVKVGNGGWTLAASHDGGLVAWANREGPIHLWRLKAKKPEEP